jgi:hypothetical protein
MPTESWVVLLTNFLHLDAVARFMAEDPLPFFATSSSTPAATEAAAPASSKAEISLEEEVDAMVAAEVRKVKAQSKLRNENGVDFAPWMNMSEEDENQIRQIMKEKAVSKRKQREQEKSVSGNLYLDSQAQELSGTGLNWKRVSDGIDLEWATNAEKDCKGFIVKRRPVKTTEFFPIASYADWGPLLSKGADGGIYRFLDTTVSPGGYVYRITEVATNGMESDVCQCLIEVQSEDEQKGAVLAAVGFVVLAIGVAIGGILLDPMDGY